MNNTNDNDKLILFMQQRVDQWRAENRDQVTRKGVQEAINDFNYMAIEVHSSNPEVSRRAKLCCLALSLGIVDGHKMSKAITFENECE